MVSRRFPLAGPVRALVFAAALGVAAPGIAAAQARTQEEVNAALRADPVIYNGMLVLGIAHGIRDICPTIEARMFRGHRMALSLYNHARSLGYSFDEITTFLSDDANKEDLREIVITYYNQQGAQVEQPETICALGLAEIAADSPAGALLRAR